MSSDRQENLHPDSIARINIQEEYHITSHFFTFTYQKSAFDMLKESGSMYRIKNTPLLKSILESYLKLESIKHESDNYMNRKMNITLQSLLEQEQVNINILAPELKQLFYFFAIHIDLESIFDDCARQIEDTLSLF
ncbi:MAG: hypothetical protein LUF04_01420 [Bacteroides sp.]|nr:hypothetical protein [Bacteroides sp.]